MTFTNAGIEKVGLAIGSFSSNRPQYMAIGSGSGTDVVGDNTLVHEVDRRTYTTVDNSTVNEMVYTGDWDSVDVSGIELKEFGMFTEATDDTGSLWSKHTFANTSFDGTTELQIQLTYTSY